MISPMFHQLLIPFLIAMFLAINMGGSGTAPAFAAAYGGNIIRRELIPGLFGIMVFLGAIIAGKGVAVTIGKGILPHDIMAITVTSVILLSVALSLLFANLLGIPQSTSQSTVFALIGPAWYLHVLKTDKLFSEIIPAWVFLPIFAFIITFILGKYIYTPLKKRSSYHFHTISYHPSLKLLVIISSLYVAFSIGANNVANASGPIPW